ncbi:hypothetical protein [Pectinatus frisingensis]|uniref:hypothetical protein n=1 Tax=Pectinatus frisingensis TaxID=865 RepID=UPI0018C77A6C|nr:hypothetical protein [Pectinatus frisingensis]
MSVKVTGLDNVLNNLQKLADNAKKLDGTHNVSFSELFTEAFMSKHTNQSSIEDFISEGGFVVNSAEDFKAIPDEEFDIHVKNNSDFDSWKEMYTKASKEYVIAKMKDGLQ